MKMIVITDVDQVVVNVVFIVLRLTCQLAERLTRVVVNLVTILVLLGAMS